MVTGRIFDIQRFSIHDGPGIRTTVFLKGCPLRCLWCGNPESIDSEPILAYRPDKCIACGDCLDACPENALSKDAAGRAVLDRSRCTGCGDCAARCDSGALEMVGRDATVGDVMEVVLRDRDYYSASGGGVTLSGGDPIFQPQFAETLLRECKTHRLHRCVETSGYALWGAFRGLLPLVDLWLYDFKESDPRRHEKYTGKSNALVIENLKRLHASGATIVLRCPIIPQHNDDRQHLDGIAQLARGLPNLKGVELLPYYDLWRAKLPRFGFTDRLPASVKPPSGEAVDAWNDYLRKRGVTIVGS